MKELSIQNEDIRHLIRTQILKGQNYKEIKDSLGIPDGTWDTNYYRNTNGFRDFLLDCNDELLRTIARKNIKDIISMNVPDNDVRYLKIKSDMTTFVSERLEKDRFGKTVEDNEDKTPINIAINNYKRIQAVKKSLPPPNKP